MNHSIYFERQKFAGRQARENDPELFSHVHSAKVFPELPLRQPTAKLGNISDTAKTIDSMIIFLCQNAMCRACRSPWYIIKHSLMFYICVKHF